jgi:curved DNA-binding protein CbpA
VVAKSVRSSLKSASLLTFSITMARILHCYRVLEVAEDANLEQIKAAYRKQAIKWHPDKNKGSKEAEEMFKLVNAAYEILCDSNKRALLDQALHPPLMPVHSIVITFSWGFGGGSATNTTTSGF